jgi:hypothetical protein
VPRYERGDFIKVEFDSDVQGLPGEWMWVRVDHCDEKRQLMFGTLDNEPVVNAEHLQLGTELAISFDKIREHRKHKNRTSVGMRKAGVKIDASASNSHAQKKMGQGAHLHTCALSMSQSRSG